MRRLDAHPLRALQVRRGADARALDQVGEGLGIGLDRQRGVVGVGRHDREDLSEDLHHDVLAPLHVLGRVRQGQAVVAEEIARGHGARTYQMVSRDDQATLPSRDAPPQRARVTASQDRLRDPELTLALDRAVAASDSKGRAPLYDKLRRASGLPGPRMNEALVRAFAAELAARGAAGDKLVAAMMALGEDVAPHGHVDEILPVLGVAALGMRAASDANAREKLLEALQEAACDHRHRVRETAADGLARVGVAVGPSFVEELLRWIGDDQPWLARAALSSLRDPEWLLAVGGEGSAALVGAVLHRIAREHRAGRRHEAYRRLCALVGEIAPAIVVRHPIVNAAIVEIVLDRKPRYATGDDEEVREAVADVAKKLDKKGNTDRARALEEALLATKKASRDPRWDRLPGKRGRGKR